MEGANKMILSLIRSKKMMVFLFVLGLAISVPAWAVIPQVAAAKSEAKMEAKSTLDNLMAAFNGESNASAKYLEFAKKADVEGYGKVASLFRAASKAESLHAASHGKVITAMGGTPKADIKIPAIKSTKENLAAAIEGETYEFTTMYPAFINKAKEEKVRDAIRSMGQANNVEKGHAKLYKEALDNLEAWKGPNKDFYVCSVCGNTVAQIDFDKCPVCFEPKTDYNAVK
jgi:rubrerythrin